MIPKLLLFICLCCVSLLAQAQTSPMTLPSSPPASQSSSLPIQEVAAPPMVTAESPQSESNLWLPRESMAKRRALLGAVFLPVGAAGSLLLLQVSEDKQLYGRATPLLAPMVSLALLTSSYALPSMGELLYGQVGKKRMVKYTAARLGVFSLVMAVRGGIVSQLRGTEQEGLVPAVQLSLLALTLLSNLSITRYEYKTLPR